MTRREHTDSERRPIHDPNSPHLDGYTFKKTDPVDEIRKGRVRLTLMGYCDDNERVIEADDLEEAIRKLKHYIRMTGMHSLVTKIGRKSDKSEIHLYNLTPEEAKRVKDMNFAGFEWSYTEGRPVKNNFQIKIHIRRDIKYEGAETAEDLQKMEELESKEPFKQLGVKRTLTGISTTAGKAQIAGVKDRLVRLQSSTNSAKLAKVCNNILRSGDGGRIRSDCHND